MKSSLSSEHPIRNELLGSAPNYYTQIAHSLRLAVNSFNNICIRTLVTLVFLLMATLSKTQDHTLPKGSSNIYLQSGKTIKGVSLWRIDSMNVEYVIKGNLADIRTSSVSKIETHDFLIEFDKRNQIIKIEYDLIILFPQDTIRGFIQEIAGRTISYIPVGSNKVKSVFKDDVKNYFQEQEKVTGLLADSAVNKKDLTRISHQAVGIEDGAAIKIQDSIPAETDYDSIKMNAEKEGLKVEMDRLYYHQSYERGINDAIKDFKGKGLWGVGGFALGMTFGSPFLSLNALDSQVKKDKIPEGADERLYRDGYENKVIKIRAKQVATGAAVAKVGIVILLILAITGG